MSERKLPDHLLADALEAAGDPPLAPEPDRAGVTLAQRLALSLDRIDYKPTRIWDQGHGRVAFDVELPDGRSARVVVSVSDA